MKTPVKLQHRPAARTASAPARKRLRDPSAVASVIAALPPLTYLTRRTKAELRPRLDRADDPCAHPLDDLLGALGQRTVAGRRAAVEPEIVLEADAHMA